MEAEPPIHISVDPELVPTESLAFREVDTERYPVTPLPRPDVRITLLTSEKFASNT